MPAVALNVSWLVTPLPALSFDATLLKPVSVDPVKTTSVVSKLLPAVLMV